MILNEKLLAIQTWIEEHLTDVECVVDVGCDHGKLLYSLYEKHGERALKFWASDIKAASLEKARKLFEEKLQDTTEDKIQLEVGAGLRPFLPLPAKSAVVIAGMGGEEIVDILRQAPLTEGTQFFLHPTKSQAFLRHYLKDYHFSYEERLCVDKGMLYTLFRAELCQEKEVQTQSVLELKQSFWEAQASLSFEELKGLWISDFELSPEQSQKQLQEARTIYLEKLSKYFFDQLQANEVEAWKKALYQALQEELAKEK